MQRSTAILSMLLTFGLVLLVIRMIQPAAPAATSSPTTTVQATAAQATSTSTAKIHILLPLVINDSIPDGTPKTKVTPTSTPKPGGAKVRESFEVPSESWQISRD